jgi:DNA-binding NarL/FixJ family response regulator
VTNAVALLETRAVQISLYASDPLTAVGIGSLLTACPDCVLLPSNQIGNADVVVVCTSSATPDLVELLLKVAGRTSARVVLVLDTCWPEAPPEASELGVAAVLARSEIDSVKLGPTIVAAARNAARTQRGSWAGSPARTSPWQREALDPAEPGPHGLDSREIEMLRLLASGMGIREIGVELSYSERTVKNTLRALITRLRLRNRTQAVAYALRTGAI